jgi:hypothetical protein
MKKMGKMFLGKKKKLHVFPLTLPTLIFCAYLKVFLTIFEQARLKVMIRMCPLQKLAKNI